MTIILHLEMFILLINNNNNYTFACMVPLNAEQLPGESGLIYLYITAHTECVVYSSYNAAFYHYSAFIY